MFPTMGHWWAAKDGDRRALAIYNRHYSAYQYKDGRKRSRFVGPGERMVLLTIDATALFVWRKFIDKCIPAQTGINCSVYRNEGYRVDGVLVPSSVLIREACTRAWQRWPGARLYTYVNASAVPTAIPGYCFRRAGFRHVGDTSTDALLILARTAPVKGPTHV